VVVDEPRRSSPARAVLQVGAERFWALETEPASVSIVTLWPDGNVSVPLVNRTDHLH
jgi:hypothetical protein